MATIFDVYDRLEIDAYKYAQQFKNADDRIKRILKNAFFMGESHIARKILAATDKEEKKDE